MMQNLNLLEGMVIKGYYDGLKEQEGEDYVDDEELKEAEVGE